MFKLADPKKSFRWPVKLSFPDGKGKLVDKSFAASFFFKSDEELQELLTKKSDYEFVRCVVDRFHELQDHLGNPVKGTDSDVKAVCSNGRIKRAIIDAFYEFNLGAEKN